MNDVLLKADLAKLLRTSVKTIERRLAHAPHLLPPQIVSIDDRQRWYRPTVEAWLAQPARLAPAWGRKVGVR